MSTRTAGPVPTVDKRRIQRLTRRIQDGADAADERAAVFVMLREAGYSYEAIAEAADVHKEAVRKAVLRRSGGYGPDGA